MASSLKRLDAIPKIIDRDPVEKGMLSLPRYFASLAARYSCWDRADVIAEGPGIEPRDQWVIRPFRQA